MHRTLQCLFEIFDYFSAPNKGMKKNILKKSGLLICCLAFAMIAFGQEDSTAAAPADSAAATPKAPKEIKKLKSLDVPEFLKEKLVKMSPDEMADMQEEYQRNVYEDGEEYTVTVKMRFMDDYIVGFIRKAPLYNSIDKKPVTTYIDIKVEWCSPVCIDSTDTANINVIENKCLTYSGIKELEYKHFKCDKWIQKTDEDAIEQFGKAGMLPPVDRKKKKKKEVTGKTTVN
jgi:hypothetical protein